MAKQDWWMCLVGITCCYITPGRDIMMEQFRNTHPGISKMKSLITDNGSSFTSEEFRKPMQETHLFISISFLFKLTCWRSSSNLQACSYQIGRMGLMVVKLAKLLFKYWITLQTTTCLSPLNGEETTDSFICPDTSKRVVERQEKNHLVSFKFGDKQKQPSNTKAYGAHLYIKKLIV